MTTVRTMNSPRSQQNQSRLLQLPAEIRLAILRELLVCQHPLSERVSYKRKIKIARRISLPRKAKKKSAIEDRPDDKDSTSVKMVTGYNIDPLILSACQQLLHEGSPILYHENTIAVRLTQDGSRWKSVTIRVLARQATSCLTQRSRREWATSFEGKNFVTRFGSLKIDIGVWRPPSYFFLRLVEGLNCIFSGRKVHAQFNFLAPLDALSVTRYANAFQLIQCQRLTLSGPPPELCSKICEAAMSDKRMRTFMQCFETLDDLSLFEARHVLTNRKMLPVSQEDLEEVKVAVMDLDMEKMQRFLDKAMSGVDKFAGVLKDNLAEISASLNT